jgi:hypothetical protein
LHCCSEEKKMNEQNRKERNAGCWRKKEKRSRKLGERRAAAHGNLRRKMS